jgi:hypothetical protein
MAQPRAFALCFRCRNRPGGCALIPHAENGVKAMSEHDWTVESEAEVRSSRIGWFAAGALAAMAAIGVVVMAVTVFDWSSDTEIAADTPPVIIEEY